MRTSTVSFSHVSGFRRSSASNNTSVHYAPTAHLEGMVTALSARSCCKQVRYQRRTAAQGWNSWPRRPFLREPLQSRLCRPVLPRPRSYICSLASRRCSNRRYTCDSLHDNDRTSGLPSAIRPASPKRWEDRSSFRSLSSILSPFWRRNLLTSVSFSITR